jgi:FkbM family methyltransferase
MSIFRRVGVTATDLACLTLGRRQVVRASRFVLRRASLDGPNDMRSNGEQFLQKWILDIIPLGRKMHVLDVGANVGQWSGSMLAAARQAGRLEDLDLHAFEPSSYTFALLSEALGSNPVRLQQVALSERSGSSILHVIGPGEGTNSLHILPTRQTDTTTEEIATTTLAEYADRARLDDIALVKIDTEGHDLSVLRGAGRLFTEQRICVAQFEYNWRWVGARSFLCDAFELLNPAGYQLGKLTSRGVEFYPRWDADLETFVEGNYVAALPSVAAELPAVAWWKE